jgi:hypothetical protein
VPLSNVEALDMFWAIGERINALSRMRRDLDGLELTQTTRSCAWTPVQYDYNKTPSARSLT